MATKPHSTTTAPVTQRKRCVDFSLFRDLLQYSDERFLFSQHAREMIEKYTVEKREYDEATEAERAAKHKHHHPEPYRVIGGLKAALKNEHVHG